jgi:hypothetical protein
MKELHKDGIIEPLDFEFLDRCEPCLMGKMTKTLFTSFIEMVSDLLRENHQLGDFHNNFIYKKNASKQERFFFKGLCVTWFFLLTPAVCFKKSRTLTTCLKKGQRVGDTPYLIFFHNK